MGGWGQGIRKGTSPYYTTTDISSTPPSLALSRQKARDNQGWQRKILGEENRQNMINPGEKRMVVYPGRSHQESRDCENGNTDVRHDGWKGGGPMPAWAHSSSWRYFQKNPQINQVITQSPPLLAVMLLKVIGWKDLEKSQE